MRDEVHSDQAGEQRLDLNVLLRLWGKTGKEPRTYHPLLFDMPNSAVGRRLSTRPEANAEAGGNE